MIIRQNQASFPQGLTPIVRKEDLDGRMGLDFGILRLESGRRFESPESKERAFLLMSGRVRFTWSRAAVRGSGGEACHDCSRSSLLDEEPTVLHVPQGAEALVECLSGTAELAVQTVENVQDFAPRLWKPGEYRSERFGEGTLQDTSTRIVRTVFDSATAPESAMVLGEVVNYPGKWSSYPPHHHPQPEYYHFRMFPAQGFGFSQQGDQVYLVRNGDTAAIPPGVVHPQTAAPGYAMYYIWGIPHLEGQKFGPDSREFLEEHAWTMDPAAQIWPDAHIDPAGPRKDE